MPRGFCSKIVEEEEEEEQGACLNAQTSELQVFACERMSYAYLFKYIIIGDTGNFNSFATLLIFDPYKTWFSELLCLADLGLRDFPSRELSPLFA
ncbi:uncharacterized protein G2W53_026896 [Senna tora]|uniref:Uncharacterized protein n=1 Tax=Senna tora TaxID=362788 RepID=A0A834TI75_9FABA|nr:uncharacterized protein G2W53_026896 [Senna tora]